MDEIDMTIVAIVVLYNRSIYNSTSSVALLNNPQIGLLVVDNSDKKEIMTSNQEYCKNNMIQYIGFGQNIGLSKAYNKGIRYILDTISEFQWLMIFDHDTVITNKYFEEVANLTSLYSPNSLVIFYPQVMMHSKHGEVLMSPSKVFPNKVKPLYINSGLVFSKKIVKNVNYNENIFVDLVDYDFQINLQKMFTNELQEIPIDAVLSQDFSGSCFVTIKNDLQRFMLYCKDCLVFCKRWKFLRNQSLLKLIKRCIHLTLHYKSGKFFIILFKCIQKEKGRAYVQKTDK